MKRSRSSSFSSRPYKKSKQQYSRFSKAKYSKPYYRPVIPGDSKQTYTFKRFGNTVNNLQWASADVGVRTEKGIALNFKLSDMAGYTDFTTLYDMYRIRAVAVYLTPVIAPSDFQLNGTGSSTTLQTKCSTVIDYDDSDVLASVGDARQYDTCKILYLNLSMNKPMVRYFTPAVATELYRSTISTGYGVKWGEWIDCSQADIPHYGFKVNLSSPVSLVAADVGVGVTIEVKYYLEFKTTR